MGKEVIRMIKFLLLWSIFLFDFSHGYKIFVYNPKTGPSHVNYVGKLADMYVKAGHDVTVYQPIMTEKIANGSKLAKVIHRPRDFFFPEVMDDDKVNREMTWKAKAGGLLNLYNTYKEMELLRKAMGTLCISRIHLIINHILDQINDDKLMDELKSEKWDIAIGENFDPCYYGVLHRLGIKNYITISTSTLYENYAMAMGIPSTPSFVPAMFSAIKPPFSYFERASNLVNYIFSKNYMHRMFGSYTDDFLKEKYGLDILEEHAKSAYYFVNADEHVDFPRPISHKVVHIGGIGKVKPKPLEPKYDEIFKKSKKGVILVSFGSVAQSTAMPDELKKTFLETFKRFPDVTFLWKYERDEDKIAEGYDNVITGKWLPQGDILSHPKLLAFVTHGGMNSVQESASKGAPMICIPLFAEQHRNAKLVEYREIGVTLNKDLLTVETFSKAIKEILENEKYNKNAKRLSGMIENKPIGSEERILKYTEFAAKFGPNLNLDMHGQHLSFVQFWCLDIIIPAIVLVLLVLYFAYRLVRKVLSKVVSILGSSKSKVE